MCFFRFIRFAKESTDRSGVAAKENLPMYRYQPVLEKGF